MTAVVGNNRTARLEALAVGLREAHLGVRLAQNPVEIEAAQALRYRVFYEEMAARPSPEVKARRLDFDRFDEFCDHLLVFDFRRGEGAAAVVGTYRLLQRQAAMRAGGFYTALEYDIAPVLAFPEPILELGRSCVDAAYRNRPTMQLLWRGISAYVFAHNIKLMFGCASLPGTDPQALAIPLTYLWYRHLAPADLRPRARPERFVDMRLLPPSAIDDRRALGALPPLIKGYLRLGGFVGDGAVIDPEFNTTDVCILVQTDLVTEKYYRHYEREARETQFRT
jgi:L-ornithine Nalpha-acyltransferase